MSQKIPKIPSAAARRLRSGAYPFGNTPLGQEARAQLATLAGQLDAIQRDERSSLAEKDAAAKRTVAAFRKRWTFTAQKAENEYRDVVYATERLDEQVRALEAKLTPFDVKRIERVASALESMDPNERVSDFRRALETKDTSRLMAHGLLDSSGEGTKRALAALVDPARFQFVLENGQNAAAHRSVAMAVDRAAAELEQVEDAWKEQRVAPRDLFDFANLGSRAVADVDSDIGVLPAAFATMVVPPKMLKPQPAPAPQQVEQPQPQAPVAGGAA